MKSLLMGRMKDWQELASAAPAEQDAPLARIRAAISQSGLPHHVVFRTKGGGKLTLFCGFGRLYAAKVQLPDQATAEFDFSERPAGATLHQMAIALSEFADSGDLKRPAFSAAQGIRPKGGVAADVVVFADPAHRAPPAEDQAAQIAPSDRETQPVSATPLQGNAAFVTEFLEQTAALHLAFQDVSGEANKIDRKAIGVPLMTEASVAGLALWQARVADVLGSDLTFFMMPQVGHGDCVALLASGESRAAIAFPKRGLASVIRKLQN